MKVIFLDIDGVLNGINYVKNSGKFGVVIDPARIKILKNIVTATDAEIVLSSSWREHWSATPNDCDEIGLDINKIFKGYKLSIYDKTPDLHFKRAEEIKAWLSDYPETTHYVILDDEELNDRHLVSHHIKTSDDAGGLTQEESIQAITILTK